ncbi:MAG TPA: AAA family ATPase [Candidatus Limnocylindrales bacterium]|nr:AAA family ATPase [Candidatus Limnocylindrales bacterium]
MVGHVATLEIRLLGPLEVIVAGEPLVVDTRKALAIVALVATDRRPFARDELAAMFWPDADDDAARGALRRTLSALRTALGQTAFEIGRARVALDGDGVTNDLADFDRLAGSSRLADLEAAASLARGPFLAGFALRDSPAFDDWQGQRAARVERSVAAVLDRLATSRAAAGDVAGAIEAASRRVELDPLDELGHRRLIELLALAGDRVGAIRHYRELVAVFDRELGVTPLRETSDLYEAIRDDRFDRGAASGLSVSASAREPGSRPAAAPAPIPLVGRDRELETLRSAWRDSEPDGRVVILEGEAGIGKTRLAEALVADVGRGSGIVLAARGYPGESAIAYGPIAALLRPGLADPDGPRRLASLDQTARADLGRLVALPAGLRPSSGAPSIAADGPGARVRLLESVAETLTRLASGPTPGLIWIDDLHLADDATREALLYLARRLADRPILLLVALRREDLTAGAGSMVEEMSRLPNAVRVVLGRLSRDAIAAMVRVMRPDAASDALIDALAVDSEGLPLHVVATLVSGETPGVSMPRDVHALLRDRLGSVSETATQVLAAAAVIGRSFDLATVRAASGRTEEETVDALEEAIRRGIVREVGSTGSQSVAYDFVHGRMRDVTDEATSLARRRLLHRRAADAIRSDSGAVGRDDVARFALIAVHEREAGRTAHAIAAFLEAADRAEAVFANREAIDHLEAAIGLGASDALVHARIGELRARLGEYPAAISALETAAALAAPAEMPGIEIRLGRVHRRRGDLVAAASHLDPALATADLPDELRARGLVERSVVALRAGDLGSAGEAASAARDLATRVGDPHLAGVAERIVGLVAQSRGDAATARAALERSVAMAADDPDPTASIAARTGLALTLASEGAVDQAMALGVVAIEACRRIGDRHLEAAVENHLADLLHDSGRDDLAMEHLKRAVALFADIGEGTAEADPGIWTLAAW